MAVFEVKTKPSFADPKTVLSYKSSGFSVRADTA